MLILLGNLGAAELILRIWGANEKYFQGVENFLTGILGDQHIIFRDQWSTDPLAGAHDLSK